MRANEFRLDEHSGIILMGVSLTEDVWERARKISNLISGLPFYFH